MLGRSDLVKRKRQEKRKKSLIVVLLIVILFIIGGSGYAFSQTLFQAEKPVTVIQAVNHSPRSVVEKTKGVPIKEPVITTITISAAGDFTLGTDEDYGLQGSFVQTASNNDFSYFVKGLNNIFKKDDLTMVNLETALTKETKKKNKQFKFKGDPSYAKILTLAGVEAVNTANNHARDYFEKGFQDTLEALDKEGIGYFGHDLQYITTIKGVKIGVLGYEGWYDTAQGRQQIKNDIQNLRQQGVQIVIVHFHWGVERQYVPTKSQVDFGRYTIDCGADLILGHHPHVLQGIEEYNGKFIVYSLGNFMYGGHRNPADKDTFVFQQTFYLEDGVLTDKKEINVVPFSISSVTNRNNFQPTMLTGKEKERVKKKIIDVSNKINGSANWLVYENEDQFVTNR